jgi:hypothetical protein
VYRYDHTRCDYWCYIGNVYMITTSALTAHLEGTFRERYEIAKRVLAVDFSRPNQIRMEEAKKALDTIEGILYEFDEANTGR